MKIRHGGDAVKGVYENQCRYTNESIIYGLSSDRSPFRVDELWTELAPLKVFLNKLDWNVVASEHHLELPINVPPLQPSMSIRVHDVRVLTCGSMCENIHTVHACCIMTWSYRKISKLAWWGSMTLNDLVKINNSTKTRQVLWASNIDGTTKSNEA